MISRRTFLKNSGALALGGMAVARTASGAIFTPAPSHTVGLQLYTVMGKMDEDLNGTLKRIAEIGYKDLESAFSKKGAFYGMKPKEFSVLVKDLGMSWRSHHTVGAPYKPRPGAKPPTGPDGKPITIPPMKNLLDNHQEIVDSVAEGGVQYLVCASTPLDTKEQIKKSIEVLNQTAEACKKAGVTLAYHNHTHEFDTVEGQVPYDLLLSETDPAMKMELDLGWATKAGKDPVELFKKNSGRFPLWHVKDLNKESQSPVEVGTGYIDFKRIFESAKISGMQYFFVEQDGAPQPLDNIATSFKNLEKILG
jgi:hypothetical protein